jgi:predicted transcriptional regulator
MELAQGPGRDKLAVMETVTNTTSALNQFLEPLSRTLGVEAARSIAALQIEPAIQARIEELAERCNEGILDESERAEYSAYVEGAEILALIKSKARRYLATHNAN